MGSRIQTCQGNGNNHTRSSEQSPQKGMAIKRSDHLRTKVWVLLPGKPLIPAKVRAGVNGTLKWMMEDEGVEFQLWAWDQTQQHTFLRLWLLPRFVSRNGGAWVDHVGSIHIPPAMAPCLKQHYLLLLISINYPCPRGDSSSNLLVPWHKKSTVPGQQL